MGLFMSKLGKIFEEFGRNEPVRVVMLGLDAAGKTTILYKLKLDENVSTIPTIGFNVETVTPCKGLDLTIWDVGGQDKIRILWHHYYQNTDGLIFVVDSCDDTRMEEACEELHSIVKCDAMSTVPVMVFANKQDLPNAYDVTKIAERLRLRELRGNQWHVQGCSAVTGDGLLEGFQQFQSMLREYKKNNHH